MENINLITEFLEFKTKDQKHLIVHKTSNRWFVKCFHDRNLASVAVLKLEYGNGFSVSDYDISKTFETFKEFKSYVSDLMESDKFRTRLKLLKKLYR